MQALESKMPKYDLDRSKAIVCSCAPAVRTDFLTLAKKENLPEENLKAPDFVYIPLRKPVVNGDAFARVVSPCATANSMDFAFVLDDGRTLLGEMKFNVDKSIRGQLNTILCKYKGSYRHLYALVHCQFYNQSFVLFNESAYEEGKSVLNRLDESFQDDRLVSELKLHFVANTLPFFSQKFF